MPESQPIDTFLCPVCDSPVPEGATRCPNVNCKEDLTSLAQLKIIAKTSYQKALDLLKEKKTSQAIELLHESTNLEPGNTENWVVLGKAYAQQGDYVSATRCWEKTLELQPGEPRASAGLERLKKIRRRDLYLSWGLRGLLVIFGIGLLSWSFLPVQTKNVAETFKTNPILAGYNIKIEQSQNAVNLAGNIPSRTEKDLVLAAAQIANPASTIDGSGLVVPVVQATLPPTEIPTITPTPIALTPTASPMPTETPTPIVTLGPTPQLCVVTTGSKNGWLNIRSGTNSDSGVVDIIREGKTLQVMGPAGSYGWLPVKTAEGISGWVNVWFCH